MVVGRPRGTRSHLSLHTFAARVSHPALASRESSERCAWQPGRVQWTPMMHVVVGEAAYNRPGCNACTNEATSGPRCRVSTPTCLFDRGRLAYPCLVPAARFKPIGSRVRGFTMYSPTVSIVIRYYAFKLKLGWSSSMQESLLSDVRRCHACNLRDIRRPGATVCLNLGVK